MVHCGEVCAGITSSSSRRLWEGGKMVRHGEGWLGMVVMEGYGVDINSAWW